MATTAPPRRFKVEPIETTTKSSKVPPHDRVEGSKRPRKFAAEPVETSTKTNRRFAPEPIETTASSSKDRPRESAEVSKRPRTIASNPIETSTKTNRRCAPEPTETSTRRSRKKFAEEWNSQTSTSPKKEKKAPRKFAPLLIETAQRSRRADDSSPTCQVNGAEASPLGFPAPPENTPTFDFSQNPLFLEIQRATSPISSRRPRPRASCHSFRVPDLEPIESSESEGSAPPSPGPSPSLAFNRIHHYKEPTRMRESVDERFSGYLLELAAKAAQKQLREQAMAAFPNDDVHEPVDHFVDRDDSYVEEAEPRRDLAFTEVDWESSTMQQHRKELEEQHETDPHTTKKHDVEVGTESSKHKPWGTPAVLVDQSSKKVVGGHQKDEELDRMRKGARPPMLGKNIQFPRCKSPEPARFDTTQGCDVVKKAMCYLTEQTGLAEEKGESLWCGNGNGKRPSKVPSLWSTGSSRSQSRTGLWAGCCVDSGLTPPRGPTGLLTPSAEKGDPLETPCPTPSATLLPPTPPASHADFACIDEKLAIEVTIEEDFGDDFVTQVYNYLSLGYPSMARPFDGELSKISNIPISELRQDDHLAQSKGYIRLGADGNLADATITEESCMRWRALRVYVREWAKQHPGMAGESLAGGVGTAARRGSWAW